jgi:hypothetical protein
MVDHARTDETNNDRLVPRSASAPPVADVNACRAMVKQGLVGVVRAPAGATDIVTAREDDSPMAFVIADAGCRALNLEPPGSKTAATDAAAAPHTGEDGEAAHDDDGAAGEAATDAPTAGHTATDAEAGHDNGSGEEAAPGAPVPGPR